MKLPMKVLLFLLICTFSYQLRAQTNTVYFPYFELISTNKDANLQYSTSKLIKSYIENNHPYAVILPEREAESYFEDEGQSVALAKAKEVSALYFMDGEIHNLQGVFIISLGLYETASGERVWHDMVKGTLEQDLDPLLSRLGRSFLTTKTAKTDIEIDEVTEYDSRGIELKQIKVNHFIGLMIGGKYLFGEETLSGLGLAYTYDATTFLFSLNFDYYPSSSLLRDGAFDERSLRNGSFSLGGMLPLSRKRSTAFIDAGLEYGFMTSRRDPKFSEDTGSTQGGIGLYAGAGYLINRNSTVNLRVYGGVSIPFYTLENQNFPGFKFGIITSFAR
ncbi:MAG: hypothetical protein ABJG78_01240 [Cyclobacteriaceae bacterium]